MQLSVSPHQLIEAGLSQRDAEQLLDQLQTQIQGCRSTEEAWQGIASSSWIKPYPFSAHLILFSACFPHWQDQAETAPAWSPSSELLQSANLAQFMDKLDLHDVPSFHRYTVQHVEDFWQGVVQQLSIRFDKKPYKIVAFENGVESPHWFPGATMNIANSCFNAKEQATAILYENTSQELRALSYGDLNKLSNCVANSLLKRGFGQGDAIGIAMPMGPLAVAIYLGIIKMGGAVVSIADSFSAEEIATRLTITQAKAIFTQDVALWAGKKNLLYKKIQQARDLDPETSSLADLTIFVVVVDSQADSPLQEKDSSWVDFLVEDDNFVPVACAPMTACNILFSSGTTGVPKAIVWNHTTAIKVASDAFFHHNIQPGDVLAWPTNLGWMMGPWLIFAALINRASLALFTEAPKDRAFGEFIQKAKVTMLGTVPTLVAHWRQTKCMEKLDWSAIKVFSSTGECSNPEDMLYLMSLAGYKPVIEYCGGTEIGGAYVTSTVIEKNYPSLFTTPAMGLDFVIVDEAGRPASVGEVAIVPPSIGLSTQLLNADHHHVYFDHMPTLADGRPLRRHGDQIKQLPSGHFCMLGRADDTMNLGGIKISAAEIERVLSGLPDIREVAAVAISAFKQGPSLLVIYAATDVAQNKKFVIQEMQKKINSHLNPLFKIHDVVFIQELPKTASNKIMRRLLREQ